jgi:hypothetical protein
LENEVLQDSGILPMGRYHGFFLILSFGKTFVSKQILAYCFEKKIKLLEISEVAKIMVLSKR